MTSLTEQEDAMKSNIQETPQNYDIEKERIIHNEILPIIMKILRARDVSYLRRLPVALSDHLRNVLSLRDR